MLNSFKPTTLLLRIRKSILYTSPITKICTFFLKLIYNILSIIVLKNFMFQLYHYKPTVKHGPFKGLKYVEETTGDGALIPILLGTYESELFPAIKEFNKNKYKYIINVGACDGYYSIGFSLIFPNTKIKAYEIENERFEYMSRMISFNGKKDQIETFSYKAHDDFLKINSDDRLLILSDCEGYEFELFDKAVIKNLLNSDIIIEVHEDIGESRIEKDFSQTHHCQKIKLDKNTENRWLVNLANYSNLNIRVSDFLKLYKENRDDRHYFLILRSKNHHN